MSNPLEFRKPDPAVSVENVRAAIFQVPPTDGRTWADDLMMIGRAFAGHSLSDPDAARFRVLRHAITESGYLNLTLQLALQQAIAQLVTVNNQPARAPYVPGSANDFCRTCKGSGKLREPSGRGTVVVSPCWACNGTGYGK